MTLTELNPEANVLSYDFARLGTAMDCTRDFALAGSAVSDVVASPGNIPKTRRYIAEGIPKAGRYIVGTIQSLAVQ